MSKASDFIENKLLPKIILTKYEQRDTETLAAIDRIVIFINKHSEEWKDE